LKELKPELYLETLVVNFSFVSQIEPKSFLEAENDEKWILAMQDDLNQFERNDVWELALRLNNQSIIGTK